MKMIGVTLITKHHCGLCDKMFATIASLSAEFPLEIDKRFIEDDPGLEERYNDSVPVLFVSGNLKAKYSISADRLRDIFAREISASALQKGKP